MSNNKLTGIAPTMTLGLAAHTSDLSTLGTTNQQPALNSLHTPTQSLVASPLSAHTINLSANTLNALNALNNPTHALNSLNASTHSGNHSSQTLLPSSQVNLVSLPQTFCFPSQPTQASMSGSSQPTALGVTLGFPVSATALTSNTISLNTNTIPLNANTIPLNANTIPLNAGSPISQQFMQSLTVGQQPTICASLPQNFSFPLSQAFLGLPSVAGASGGQFLSTTFSQFPGLPSVIMGSQQSVLQGTLMGSTSAGQSAQLQALDHTLNSQSLSFPVTPGPVVTELPISPQPSHQIHALADKQQSKAVTNQVSQQTPSSDKQELQLQSSADQRQGLQKPPGQESFTDHVHEQTSQQFEEPEVSSLKPAKEGAGRESPPSSSSSQTLHQEQSSNELSTSIQKPPEVEQTPSELETTDSEHSCSDLGNIEESKIAEDVNKDSNETVSKNSKDNSCESVANDCSSEDIMTLVTQTQEDHVTSGTSEAIACTGDIKQEVLECEESDSAVTATLNIADSCRSLASSPVKLENSRDQANGLDSASQGDSTDSTQAFYSQTMLQHEATSENSGVICSLLTSLKQEAMDAEEEEEMVLPDSMPASEDSLDSYSQRYSPSPMASLQLTRADTTTFTTTTAAYSRSRLDDTEGLFDVKHFATSDCMSVDFEETEFVWEDYLQETGATAVPPTAFKHVECSLQSGFVKGMRVEVANKSTPGTYWVAAVIITCGPLLHLRYEGYEEDGSGDFWCDLSTCEIHPIGWCAENDQLLVPPEGVKDKHKDWMTVLHETLKTAPAAPSYLLDKTTGTSPIDQLKQGMRLEIQDSDRPTQVWLARIMENVGGRLYLSLEGMDSGVADFWAFYLYELLHPIGWAKTKGYSYQAPKVLSKQGLSEDEIQHILNTALKEAEDQKLPSDIFMDQVEIKEHSFKRGMKLEAVNPISRNHIGPATVTEVIDKFYFIVEMDDFRIMEPEKRTRFCCHSGTPTIFPIQWTVYKGIKLTAPPGWPKSDFNWTEYLNHCRALAAPESCFHLDYEEHEFERGMKLECVNPDNPNQICAATITKLVAHLMWVHLDSSTRIVASHVEPVTSHNLFPVGWCESNSYQLRPPRRAGVRAGSLRKRVAVVQPEMAEGNQGKEEENEGWMNCPKIYFNHKCFSGPHLSKGRIAELPCSVGPGPLNLVMKEVLSMLISVAYKSSRVLREIQLDGPPNPAMTQQILKAKYKNKSYRAVVEICRTTNQLEDFCRQVCIKLECCPNLISPHFVGDNCPERCSQLTKTKYTYYYGKKKRKIGRPPGGHSNLENGPKKPTKRRKRRRLGMVVRKSHPFIGEEMEEDEDEDKTSETSDTPAADSSSSTAMSRISDHKPHSTSAMAAASKRLKRKYTHHIPPPSEIRTRGAKLPRYSFERRTHKKILLSPAPSGVSGLRSKSHQINKPQRFTRTSSPELSRPQALSVVSSLTPTSVSCHSPLTIMCPSTPLSLMSPSAPFSFPPPCSPLPFDKNPLHWTVSETVEFIRTTDCAHVAKMFKEQEIDGQALLLLTLPTVQEHLELKLGPAIKLCHEIERVKRAFYTRYDTAQSSNYY